MSITSEPTMKPIANLQTYHIHLATWEVTFMCQFYYQQSHSVSLVAKEYFDA